MAALTAIVFSTGLAWGAEAPVEKEPESAPVQKAQPAKKERSPAQKAQQEKMKTCNAEAGKKELKGAERKKFMSECLKGSTKTP
ncbi:MAG: PsiF family protein [Candidatus Accumulibacter sp.]|nr:PsiF family protein [Accumulibacter sp.]